MNNILDTIVAYKKQEIANLPVVDVTELKPGRYPLQLPLQGGGLTPRLIAEIKPASPITGRLLPADLDISKIAEQYAAGGVAAISVLTDQHFFQGSFKNLELARQGASELPLLCKDFILDKKQIHLARQHGADSYLLIAKILTAKKLQALIDEGRKFKMEPLVEIADQADLDKLLKTDAKLVGINNRDLGDFSLNLNHTFSLARQLPKGVTVCSLSGFNGADIQLVSGVADAVLVGSKFCKNSEKIPELLKQFTKPRPLAKFCGLRNLQDYQTAIKLGVNLIGLNFVPSSKRFCKGMPSLPAMASLVGVFQNQTRFEVEKIAKQYKLQFIQLHGEEKSKDWKNCKYSIIKAIAVTNSSHNEAQQLVDDWQNVAALFLVDAAKGGSGEQADLEQLRRLDFHGVPYLLAGGITPDNVNKLLSQTNAIGFDVAGGIENTDKTSWNAIKMLQILREIN